MKKNRGLKLLTIFLTLGSLMALSGCNTIARYSEHFDFGGAISEEEEEGSTEHEAGSHPTEEWYPITYSNYWNFSNLPANGYTPSGSGTTYYKFYLTENLSIGTNFWFSGDITCTYTFCLNGHTLSTSYRNDPVIWMDGGTLHICDCCANGETGGHIEGHNATSSSGTGTGGAIHMSAGTLVLDSGIISNSTALYDGGGVYVDEGGTFTMNDGYIMDNTVIGEEGRDDSGGGIYVADGGTFTMNGGTIKGNSAYNGGGICVATNGTININGGSITGNTADNEGGGILGIADEEDDHSNSATINMKGNPYISGNSRGYYESNVAVNDYVYINLTGEITSGASIGVHTTSGEPGQITTKETSTTYYVGAYNYFFADNLEYAILKDDANRCLRFDTDQAGTKIEGSFKLSFEFYYNGVNQKCPEWGEIWAEGTWNDWESLEQLTEEQTNGVYSYYLTLENITVGRYSCQLVLEYPGQDNFEHKITADGDLVFRIPSSSIDTQEYTVIVDVYDSFDDILQNSNEKEGDVTVRIEFTYKGDPYKVSDWLLIYLVSDDWDYDDNEWYLPERAILLQQGYDEDTGTYYYYYNFSEIGVYSYHVQAYAHYNGEHEWNTEIEYIGDFYLDVTTTDEGSTIVLNIDLEVDLEIEMPDVSVNVIYNLTLTLTIQGDDLVCPDYGYFVLVSDFSYDTSQRGEYIEFPIHVSEERSAYTNYQMWETDPIVAVASGNYNFDIEFRYYDDDYNTELGTMSIFTEGTSYNYYIWSTEDHTVNCDIYNFEWNTTFVNIEETYPDYDQSSIAFNDGEHEVGVGGSLTTSVTTDPANATVTYESSDPSIAYVDEDGTIYGVGLGTATITATARAEDYYKSTDTYEVQVVSVDSFTYHISILDYNGNSLGVAPDNAVLYAAGDFNGTWNTGTGNGGWYDWGEEVELTWNEEKQTYDLELDFIPEEGRSFEIIIKDDDYVSDDDEWSHVLGTYNIGEHDMSQIGDVEEYISVTTQIGQWSDVWEGKTSDFYVVLLDNSSTRTDTINTTEYSIVFNAYSNIWNGNNYCEANQLVTSANQLALYSDLVDVSAMDSSNKWFNVGVNDVSYMRISDANIPVARDGYIPVYVNYGWMSDDWLNNTYPDSTPGGDGQYTETIWDATIYSWMFMDESESIDNFISSLSWIG